MTSWKIWPGAFWIHISNRDLSWFLSKLSYIKFIFIRLSYTQTDNGNKNGILKIGVAASMDSTLLANKNRKYYNLFNSWNDIGKKKNEPWAFCKGNLVYFEWIWSHSATAFSIVTHLPKLGGDKGGRGYMCIYQYVQVIQARIADHLICPADRLLGLSNRTTQFAEFHGTATTPSVELVWPMIGTGGGMVFGSGVESVDFMENRVFFNLSPQISL